MNTVYITSSGQARYIGLGDEGGWLWVRLIGRAVRFETRADARKFILGNPVLAEAYEEGGLWILG
jgi:hypothetical protein